MALGAELVAPSEVRPSLGHGRVALMVGAGILIAVLGYVLGIHHSRVTVVTGPVQVGDQIATMTVNGTSYGISQSIPWIDITGSTHEGGWPDCLATPAPAVPPIVRFAVTRVVYPDGSSTDQVLYVDCRH